MPRSVRLPLVTAAASAVTLAVAASGSGGQAESAPDRPAAADPEQQVRAAIMTLERSRDAQALCGQLTTPRFVSEVYGSQATCERKALGDDPSARATVERLMIAGDTATVTVRLAGGRLGGAQGSETLLRQSGRWRLDRYGTDLVRSLFVVGLTAAGSTYQREAGLSACFTRRVADLDEPTVRRYLFTAARGKRAATRSATSQLIGTCKPQLIRALTLQLVGEVAKDRKIQPVQLACLRRAVPKVLGLIPFSETALDKDKGSWTAGVQTAVAGCAADPKGFVR